MTGKNAGRHCYYCVKIFDARYKCKGWSLGKLETQIGSGDEEHRKFFAYMTNLVDQLKLMGEAGRDRVNVDWGKIDTVIKKVKKTRSRPRTRRT
eukprot:809712-Pyramimonas_sp.AAC.1